MLDPALLRPGRFDLGTEWKEWTGLPFVFAVWAARRDVDQAEARQIHRGLVAARDWGLAHIEELAHQASDATGIDPATCRNYLSGIDYALSDRHLEGLTTFFNRLTDRGLVRDGTLSFLSVA